MANKVTLVGRVGQDPEVRATTNGNSVANFSLATSRRYTQNGERKEDTQWHRIVVFGKLADIVSKYVTKGNQLYCEGRIEYGSYEKDGQKVYTTNIIMEQMEMLGGRSDGQSDGAQMGRQQASAPANQSGGFDDFDEDIPF